ncbi:mycofactocin-coupled SDR family oxidoreductase [Pseudonocardia pini]|uniref:mycofactocin-coupled SDR family oxidoreductase n=1 Tax=Pseudonocardia pini TaxID=2758030 RepID=UPI0015F06802|nr:mycofactocin-coupled SDR family oxidoreductase [Pseudonocardia pini]
MSGRFAGRVALVTGAARGQGRAHALRMAREGADVIGIDLCAQIESCEYRLGTETDLAETAAMVEAEDRTFHAEQADVRDRDGLARAIERGLDRTGRIDFVIANAGIGPMFGPSAATMQAWQDAVDVLLTGAYNTVDLVAGHLVAERRGAIVLTSSVQGMRTVPAPFDKVNHGFAAYTAAKHGVVGVMRHFATMLGPYGVRCNSLHPGPVDTPLVRHPGMDRFLEDFAESYAHSRTALPLTALDPADIAAAAVWLCSDDARWVTGVTLPVDGGHLVT